MLPDKPFSQACENNKGPILAVLKKAFAQTRTVVEVGSGTGQHAVYFAAQLPHLQWQPTDLAAQLPGMQLWFEEAGLPNLLPPRVLDVVTDCWPLSPVDGLFTANTLHIMGTREVAYFFAGLTALLQPGGRCCIYGPFNYGGRFTSDSNARFNDWLRQQNPKSAIRDFEWIQELAEMNGLALLADHQMPANNRLLEWVMR